MNNQKPNLEQASKYINWYNMRDCTERLKYIPAYIVSNENLRCAMKYLPENANNVLTVAASGDHPLFCKLYGAKNVTTFDVTYNARVIMDIKTAALEVLDLSQYWQLLCDLRRSKNTLSVKNMDKILPLLHPEVREYIEGMNGFRLFTNGLSPESYLKYAPLPTEYRKMQQQITKPFDFIWSNITNLELTESYDFIHMSNIFDYIGWEEKTNVLLKMLDHTNMGGVLYFEEFSSRESESMCLQLVKAYPNKYHLLSHGCINVLRQHALQRVG